MSNPTLYRVHYPMRTFQSGLEPWAWADAVVGQFPEAFRESGEVWLDELSDAPSLLKELTRAAGLPQPCTSLVGFADVGRLDPYETFELRFKQVVELEQGLDNFDSQQKCAWPFPVMRYGVSGCGRGKKQRLNCFRFPKKYKAPRHDLFLIAPGPRLPPYYFGVSQRALDAFENAGISGYIARPILLNNGSESGSFEIEISGRTRKALPRNHCLVERVCDVCDLFHVWPDPRDEITHMGPHPDIFSDADVQVCTTQTVDGVIYHADDLPPFVSRSFIDVCARHQLTGLNPGAAGGRFEPVVSERAYQRLRSGIDTE